MPAIPDPDVYALVRAYQAGTGAPTLAKQYGVSVWLVLKRLREAGVQINKPGPRPVWMAQPRSAGDEFQQLLDGLLLGDGSIDRKGFLRIEQENSRLGWLHLIQESLARLGASAKIIPLKPKTRRIEEREVRPKASSLLYTPSYMELRPERQRWYPNGIKIVPPALALTPVSLTHWFCGDGSRSGDGVKFYTNGFTKTDVEFLVYRLAVDLGISAHAAPRPLRGKEHEIFVRRIDEAQKVKDLIRPLMPECCLYKLEQVRPKKPHPSRRLTDPQVVEIRQRAKTETATALALEYGVSDTAIRNIVIGKCYKRLPLG